MMKPPSREIKATPKPLKKTFEEVKTSVKTTPGVSKTITRPSSAMKKLPPVEIKEKAANEG